MPLALDAIWRALIAALLTEPEPALLRNSYSLSVQCHWSGLGGGSRGCGLGWRRGGGGGGCGEQQDEVCEGHRVHGRRV